MDIIKIRLMSNVQIDIIKCLSCGKKQAIAAPAQFHEPCLSANALRISGSLLFVTSIAR